MRNDTSFLEMKMYIFPIFRPDFTLASILYFYKIGYVYFQEISSTLSEQRITLVHWRNICNKYTNFLICVSDYVLSSKLP